MSSSCVGVEFFLSVSYCAFFIFVIEHGVGHVCVCCDVLSKGEELVKSAIL